MTRTAEFGRWALSWLEEKRDGSRRLSGTRLAVAVFTAWFVSVIRPPLNWPTAFLGFCVLFAIAIAKALDRAPAEKVVDAVTGMFGKPTEGATWMADKVINTRAVDDPTVPMGKAET